MRFPCNSTADIIERTPEAGSLFCAKPIRHTMPSEKRQAGQISMSEILEGKLKIEDLSRIISTSVSRFTVYTAVESFFDVVYHCYKLARELNLGL